VRLLLWLSEWRLVVVYWLQWAWLCRLQQVPAVWKKERACQLLLLVAGANRFLSGWRSVWMYARG
jgi:hypothetical protein